MTNAVAVDVVDAGQSAALGVQVIRLGFDAGGKVTKDPCHFKCLLFVGIAKSGVIHAKGEVEDVIHGGNR